MHYIYTYVLNNPFQGLKNSPLKNIHISLLFVIIFGLFAFGVWFRTGLLEYHILNPKYLIYLPFTLFILPSLCEEFLFRGLFIPQNTYEKGIKSIAFFTLLNTSVFVIWHPLVTIINPVARNFFFDPAFLIIVFALGIVCSLSYIFSKSLWVPIFIHWLTVVIWVFFFSGRNMILD